MEAQEILQNTVFVVLYGGVIMLNMVAALYLLFRRGNAIAPEVTSPVPLRRWAAAFMIASALSHLFWLFYASHPTPAAYVIVCGLDQFMFFPTIAGILVSMMQDRHRTVWPVLVLQIPSLVLMSLCLIRGDEDLYTPVSIYIFALYAVLMLNTFLAVRHYRRWLRDNYADLENKEIWLSLLILAVFLLFFIMYSATEGNRVLLFLLQIDNIVIVGLLLWRVETLQQLSECAPQEEESAEEVQKASAPPAIPPGIGHLLKKHCEDGQLYLQHDLTLAQLAQIIGTNRYYLSQHFAQQGITYNAYINGLRVRHFIRLYREAVADQRIFTAQQLAFESGFHSYSTFGATFKRNIGMTVTQWMRSAAE
ncbi:MAG: helix-turn-helix transcriptional regulator [Bacteroidales bacterium]|nr:helix-turn-helix transcriptional regulator [Bacteroidales bacterium]